MNWSPQTTRVLSKTILLLILIAVSPVFGQNNDQDLPSGEEVLARHIEAAGGQEAFDKIQNRLFRATIEITSAGITLDSTTWLAKPNKLISTITADALGTINKGCTGTAAWSMSDMQGPVIEQGAALENQLRDSQLDRLVYWNQVYQSAECVAIEKVNGVDCFKVVLTPHPYRLPEAEDAEVSLLTAYIDKETHLVSKIESNAVTEAGTIDIEAWLSDYKTVDDIKIAHRTELKLAGQTRVVQIQSIEHNVELADNHFDPPAEIQKLLDKAAAKAKGDQEDG